MEAVPQDIRVYRTIEGKRPFLEWFRSLTPEIRADVAVRVRRIRDGNFGDVKPVGEGVSELRFHAGTGTRLYYARDGIRVVLLLTGGDKSTQQRDIQRAKKYWQEYQKRTRSSERPETDEWQNARQ